MSIIDPRTGEKLKHWTKLDAAIFCEVVTNFLSDNELPTTHESPSSANKKNSTSTDEELKASYKDLNLNNPVSKKVRFNSEKASKEIIFDNSSPSTSSDDADASFEEQNSDLKHKLSSKGNQINGDHKAVVNGKSTDEDKKLPSEGSKKGETNGKENLNTCTSGQKTNSQNGETKIRKFETQTENNGFKFS